jgi:hypothetical protein
VDRRTIGPHSNLCGASTNDGVRLSLRAHRRSRQTDGTLTGILGHRPAVDPVEHVLRRVDVRHGMFTFNGVDRVRLEDVAGVFTVDVNRSRWEECERSSDRCERLDGDRLHAAQLTRARPPTERPRWP